MTIISRPRVRLIMANYGAGCLATARPMKCRAMKCHGTLPVQCLLWYALVVHTDVPASEVVFFSVCCLWFVVQFYLLLLNLLYCFSKRCPAFFFDICGLQHPINQCSYCLVELLWYLLSRELYEHVGDNSKCFQEFESWFHVMTFFTVMLC